MFEALARFVVRRRVWILWVTLAIAVASGILARDTASRLVNGGFDNPDAESSRARDFLDREFETSDPDLVLVVTATASSVDDPAVVAAGIALGDRLASEAGVSQVVSYWNLGEPDPLRSRDASQALVLAVVPGDDDAVTERMEQLSPRYTQADDGIVEVAVTGFAEVFRQVNEQVEEDLIRAETIALPVTLFMLLLVFGSVVAAGLPLVVGGVALAGAFLVLWVVAAFTEVSIFALNLTTMMSLGLGIDYSLFVVSRFREEMRRGLDPHAAAAETVATAGRTIAFSALTVAVSLLALLVFPLSFLRSFAYAGIAVALLAAAAAAVSLPALLAVLGSRVDRFVLWRRAPKAPSEGFWYRTAHRVMRRPIPVALTIVAVLGLLGVPFLRLDLGIPDDRVLPESASSRRALDDIRHNFGTYEADTLQVVVPLLRDPGRVERQIDDYATALSRIEGVARVDARTGVYTDGEAIRTADFPSGPVHDTLERVTARFAGTESTWFSVVPSVEPLSPQGEQLARRVRALDGPFATMVGGGAAVLVDAKSSLYSRMPVALTWIALSTFVLLFAMFGSVLVPVKALVINVLSLSAAFGAMVWVFQDGHLSSALDFTAAGTITATMPILLFCLAFGLSMDYEVFLLSRIKEEHDRGAGDTEAIAVGLHRTGRIVTAAALLISVVFLAFATSGVMFIKMFGITLTLAVLIDAFVIRLTLVPAFMKLAGRWNWWAPRPLRRIYERFGLHESRSEPPDRPADLTSSA